MLVVVLLAAYVGGYFATTERTYDVANGDFRIFRSEMVFNVYAPLLWIESRLQRESLGWRFSDNWPDSIDWRKP